MVALCGLAVGSVVAGLAPSFALIVIGRAIQGIGGGVLPLSFGIIRDEFPPDKVATGVGVVAASTAVGGGAGLVIAGPIISGLGFHWLFWFPLIVAVVGIVCARFFVPKSLVRTRGRISWSSALLMSAWLVAILVAISDAPVWGWASSKVIGLEVLGAILLVIWVWIENRSSQPIVDMKMMRIPGVWTTNVVSFLFGVGMYSVFAFLPEFLQTPRSTGYGFGASIVSSGLFLLPMCVGMFIFGVFTGKIAARMGSKFAVVVGSSISTSGYVILALAHHHAWEIYASSALLGAGLGLAYSALANLIVHAVSSSHTGVASGMNANIRTVGGAVGAAVMSSIVTASRLRSGFPNQSGYVRGFIFLSVVTLVSVVASILIPKLPEAKGGERHLAHAELAIIPGGTITEG